MTETRGRIRAGGATAHRVVSGVFLVVALASGCGDAEFTEVPHPQDAGVRPTFSLRMEARSSEGLPLSDARFAVFDAAGQAVDDGAATEGVRTVHLVAGIYDVSAWTGTQPLGTRQVALSTDKTVTFVTEPDLPPPPMEITLSSDPARGSGPFTSSQVITLGAQVTGGAGVARVEFWKDALLIATVSAPPFEHRWSITAADNGTHVWTARVVDTAGASADSGALELDVLINLNGCPALPPISSFVTRNGARLLVDGQVFRAAGTNLYYLQQELSYAQQFDATREARIHQVLDDAVCMNAGVIRMWAFNDTENDPATIQSSPGMYREEGLKGLDQAVAEARARGLRVILTLVNNWPEYGGLNRYAQWAGKSHDAFFTDAQMKGWYRDYATMLAARVNTFTGIAYRDEPAILAVEIGNELRCASCGNTTTLRNTVAELAQHLRTVFPLHLIGDGGEGFDDKPQLYPGLSNTYAVSGAEGSSYSSLVNLPELDLVSYHAYPPRWGLNTGTDMQRWIDTHESLAKNAGKVAYFGEYGHVAADSARATVYDAWLGRTFSTNMGTMALFWQLMPDGLVDGEGLAIYYASDPVTVDVLSSWGGAL